jgi:hypothetical protein
MATLVYRFDGHNPLQLAPSGFTVATVVLGAQGFDTLLREYLNNFSSSEGTGEVFEEISRAFRENARKPASAEAVFHCAPREDSVVNLNIPEWQREPPSVGKVYAVFLARAGSLGSQTVMVRQIWPKRWETERSFPNTPKTDFINLAELQKNLQK